MIEQLPDYPLSSLENFTRYTFASSEAQAEKQRSFDDDEFAVLDGREQDILRAPESADIDARRELRKRFLKAARERIARAEGPRIALPAGRGFLSDMRSLQERPAVTVIGAAPSGMTGEPRPFPFTAVLTYFGTPEHEGEPFSPDWLDEYLIYREIAAAFAMETGSLMAVCAHLGQYNTDDRKGWKQPHVHIIRETSDGEPKDMLQKYVVRYFERMGRQCKAD